MNNKLVLGLKSLTSEDREQFKLFLHSPYHNSRVRSISCWEYFEQFAPVYPDDRMSIDALGKYLFQEKPVQRQAILDEVSHLYRLLKSFWEHELLKSDVFLQRTLRLRQLDERRLEHLYTIERKAAHKLLNNANIEREKYYQYELSWASIDNEQFGRQQLRTFDESLARKLYSLDVYYLILVLRESCEALNRQHILNTEYKFYLLPAITTFLETEEHPYRSVPMIEGYYQIYQSLQPEASEQTYDQLLSTLRLYRDQFSKEEVRAMYKYAQNFCIRKINEGKAEFDQRLFELFQELLEEGIILMDNRIAHTDYKNISTIGIRVKAYEWVSSFLESYKDKVLHSFRDNVYAYCRAALVLEQGDPQQAIRLLYSISHTDIHYQISARQLLLKIYYSNADTDTILYTIDSFRQFLVRNKEVPKTRKTYHLSFLKLFKAFCLLKDKFPIFTKEEAQKRLDQLSAKLSQSDSLANRSWLMEEMKLLHTQL